MRTRIQPFILYFFLFSITIAINGCAIKEFGRSVKNSVKGDYYLQAKDYQKGRKSFKEEVKQNPESSSAHYYYGRFLLQENNSKLALTHLKKAVALAPKNSDYRFWQGIAYSANNQPKFEEKSYRTALSINPKHLQSLIYLGHTQLERKKFTKALELYIRALDIWPDSPSALYNRALTLKKLGRTPEETLGWHEYLKRYPTGSLARQATTHLNNFKDFSYRNYTLGSRIITTQQIRFDPFTFEISKTSEDSLLLVGSIFSNMGKGTLQIVMYQKNNKLLAKQRAIATKRYITEAYPKIDPKKIGVSWFSTPQKVRISSRTFSIDESVDFFISK